MHHIEGPSVTIFLQKGGGSFDSLGDESMTRGVIWHEIAQNRMQILSTTILKKLENFDRKNNNWGSLGVNSCKTREAFSKKENKMQTQGGLLSGKWQIQANGSKTNPRALDLIK